MRTNERIKYIGLDLDGTLLTPSKSIGSETLEFIKGLHRKGYRIILVSGRHYREISPYIKQFGQSTIWAAVSCDGEYVHDNKGNTIYQSKLFRFGDLKLIKDILIKYKYSIITPSYDIQYQSSFIKRLIRKFYYRIKCIPIRLIADSQSLSEDIIIEKINIYNNKVEEPDLVKLRDYFTVHVLDEGRCEILPKGVNKYTALCVMEDMGLIRMSNLLYFGNDINDLECFENIEMCIAMSDSPDVLKEKALFVTDDCANEGVLKGLRKLLL